MAIRNMWSLNPGEVLVAEELQERISGCEIYFPLKDVGIDLLVVKDNRHCSIQVKESRLHAPTKKWQSTWHQVTKSNICPPTNSKVVPDFFFFLTYVPVFGVNRLTKFDESYIIVPVEELRRFAGKKKDSQGKYNFYFVFDEENGFVKEIREHTKGYRSGDGEDYSRFLGAWNQIMEILKN